MKKIKLDQKFINEVMDKVESMVEELSYRTDWDPKLYAYVMARYSINAVYRTNDSLSAAGLLGYMTDWIVRDKLDEQELEKKGFDGALIDEPGNFIEIDNDNIH